MCTKIERIPLFTTYDCFYTTLELMEEICPVYNQAVVAVLSGKDEGLFFPVTADSKPFKPLPIMERIVFPSLSRALSIFAVRQIERADCSCG